MTDDSTEVISSSPLDDLPGEPTSNRARHVWTGVGVTLVVLGAAYVGGVFYTADRTPRDATVAGVEVGGLTSADAVTALTDGLADRVAEPIAFTVNDVAATLDPAQAGLALDAEASIDQLTGRSWDPRIIVERLFGNVEAEPVVDVDTQALDTALSSAQEIVQVAPVDATIVFANGEAVVTAPVDGSELDVPAAAEVISASWLRTDETLDLPVTSVAPALGQDAVDAAMTGIVEPLLSAPVTVAAGDQTTTLDPAQLAGMSTLVGQDGAFVLQVAPDALSAAVSAALPSIGAAAQDARFEFSGGKPTIVPSVDGTGLDATQLTAAVTAAAVSPTERTATAELVASQAAFTTADAEALGINEVIGEFSTPLPSYPDPPRTENLRIGSGRVTGILLQPGETFSLLDTLSPFTAANGYNQSGVVVDGFESKAYGGGLSQLSTTLFNASFEAGLEDVTHKPHSRWFSRYPEGREATLFEGSVDMKFTNTTDHGILLQAWVGDDSRVHAQIWGTPTFDTTITTGARYNITAPRTVYNTKSNCIAESGGQSGFSVNVTRVVKRLDGTPVSDKTYSWTYSPWNKVICGPEPASTG